MQNLSEYGATAFEAEIDYLSDSEILKLKTADANPFVKISLPDRSIPFVILPDGGIVADITANNPKAVLNNAGIALPADKPAGAGFIEVHHGRRALLFRAVESAAFQKKWFVEEVASVLQTELKLYYPGYKIIAQ